MVIGLVLVCATLPQVDNVIRGCIHVERLPFISVGYLYIITFGNTHAYMPEASVHHLGMLSGLDGDHGTTMTGWESYH